jgi:hypothetical protein
MANDDRVSDVHTLRKENNCSEDLEGSSSSLFRITEKLSGEC